MTTFIPHLIVDIASQKSGRVGYGASTLACPHDSMANHGAGLGLASEQDVRRLGQQAGFGSIHRLPLDDLYIALYQLKE